MADETQYYDPNLYPAGALPAKAPEDGKEVSTPRADGRWNGKGKKEVAKDVEPAIPASPALDKKK